jgi:hypothetical protein
MKTLLTILAISLVTPLGFALKYYSGPGGSWCNLYGAAIMYEVFWCLVVSLFCSKRQNLVILCIAVFVATSIIEFLQLSHTPALEWIRSYRVGVWLIGNGFDWLDFPHYVIGCFVGWLVVVGLSFNQLIHTR